MMQCRRPPARREVQIPSFEVQIADFSAGVTGVAMGPPSRGGTVGVPTDPGVSERADGPDHPDLADNEANTKWVKDGFPAVHPRSGSEGGYVNVSENIASARGG